MPKKEEEIIDRKFNLIHAFHSKIIEIDGLPEPKSPLRRDLWKLEQQGKEPNQHLALKAFLEKKGMNENWRSATMYQAFKIGRQALVEAANQPPTIAIGRSDAARILKKMRSFFEAIKEAKSKGIT